MGGSATWAGRGHEAEKTGERLDAETKRRGAGEMERREAVQEGVETSLLVLPQGSYGTQSIAGGCGGWVRRCKDTGQ